MRVDGHTHLTAPASMLLQKLEEAGFAKAVVCSAGLARGEAITSLCEAKIAMARIGRAQNLPDRQVAIKSTNEHLAAVVAEHRDKLIGFGKVDLFDKNLLKEAETVVELGLNGIGEVIGIHQNVELLVPLFQFSHDHHGFPLFLHCDYPVDAGDLREIFRLARRFSGARLIIGHLGGDFWLETLEMALASPNVYLDTSEVVNGVALRVAVHELPERVIFASDFPWDCPGAMLKRLEAMTVDASVKRQVLGLNILQLLKF